MTVTIQLTDEQAATLKGQAAAAGLSVEDWLQKLAAEQLSGGEPKKPSKSAYGVLAKYGPAPSAEEIDRNRAEMFRGFASDV